MATNSLLHATTKSVGAESPVIDKKAELSDTSKQWLIKLVRNSVIALVMGLIPSSISGWERQSMHEKYTANTLTPSTFPVKTQVEEICTWIFEECLRQSLIFPEQLPAHTQIKAREFQASLSQQLELIIEQISNAEIAAELSSSSEVNFIELPENELKEIDRLWREILNFTVKILSGWYETQLQKETLALYSKSVFYLGNILTFWKVNVDGWSWETYEELRGNALAKHNDTLIQSLQPIFLIAWNINYNAIKLYATTKVRYMISLKDKGKISDWLFNEELLQLFLDIDSLIPQNTYFAFPQVSSTELIQHNNRVKEIKLEIDKVLARSSQLIRV